MLVLRLCCACAVLTLSQGSCAGRSCAVLTQRCWVALCLLCANAALARRCEPEEMRQPQALRCACAVLYYCASLCCAYIFTECLVVLSSNYALVVALALLVL